MGHHITDFREHRRGLSPADWRHLWVTGRSVVEGCAYDLQHRNSLVTKGPAVAAQSALAWNAPAGDTGFANQESHGLFRAITPISAGRSLLGLRLGDPSSDSYRVVFGVPGSTIEIYKRVSGASSQLGISTFNLAVGGFYRWRFRATGTTISLRMWADGDAEPGTWQISVTDSAIATGGVGILQIDPGESLEVGFFSVGTNGDSAPGEESLPLPLDQWCMIPDVIPEVTFGIERADPVTGIVSKKWYTNRGPRHTGPADFPPNEDFESVIVNAGGFGQRLEADALFGAQALSSIQQVELRNLPTAPNGPGLLDDWDNYTFAGRPFEIRVGDMTKPHRAFELLATPDVLGEPAVTPEKATVQLANPAGEAPASSANRKPATLKQAVRVRTYVGIPTGVSILTATTSGASAPSHAAYNLLSFVAKGRLRTTGLNSGGGSGASFIAARQISSTNRQFQLAMYWLGHATLAGKIQVNASVVGVDVTLGITTARYDDGADHWWALGISDSDRFFLLVDGAVALSGAMTGSVDLPAAPWTWATGAKDGLFYDHGMSTWLTEDEVRSSMASRLAAPPPSNWVAFWPGDDATGNTVTDYSVNANHATLAGVSGTNFRWDPTDAGSADQAGRPMPLSLGVLFNSVAEMVDPLRGRFRVNDAAIPAGTVISPVKARALPITLTTDYTLPAPGVIDMVTAQSEPVTADLVASSSPESAAIHLPRVISDALVARHPAGTAEHLDSPSFEAVRKIIPYRGGGRFEEPPSGEALLDLLGPLGAHYFQGRSGRIAAGYLLPPVNPGPYGQDTLLEFLGLPDQGVTFSANSAYSLKQNADGFYLWAWVKPSLIPAIDPATSSSFTYFPSGQTIIDRCGTSATGYYLGVDGRNGQVIFGSPGVTSTSTGLHYTTAAAVFVPGCWTLILGWHWKTSNQRILIVSTITAAGAGAGGSSNQEATSGTMIDPVNEPLRIGHGPRGSFSGAIQYAVGESTGFNPTPGMISYLTARPTGGQFRVELRDGDGDLALDSAQSRFGRIAGARWCPRHTLDFRVGVEPEFAGQLRLRPAWRSNARFRNNSSPVTGADVAATVTGAQRLAAGTPWLEVPVENQAVRDVYRDARELALHTFLSDRDQAAAVAERVRSRFDPSRRTADARRWRKDALRLQLTDEILLYHHRFGLDQGKACRVASLASVLSPEILIDLSTWR